MVRAGPLPATVQTRGFSVRPFSFRISLMTAKNLPSRKKAGGTQTIFWWIVWISLTIASFFAASAFWTPFIAKHFGSILETRNAVIWIGAVFGTWMVFLVPLIILMYQKVDKAY